MIWSLGQVAGARYLKSRRMALDMECYTALIIPIRLMERIRRADWRCRAIRCMARPTEAAHTAAFPQAAQYLALALTATDIPISSPSVPPIVILAKIPRLT